METTLSDGLCVERLGTKDCAPTLHPQSSTGLETGCKPVLFSLQELKTEHGFPDIVIPQAKPLSPGTVTPWILDIN